MTWSESIRLQLDGEVREELGDLHGTLLGRAEDLRLMLVGSVAAEHIHDSSEPRSARAWISLRALGRVDLVILGIALNLA